MDADYVDDLGILHNITAQAKFLLHSLKQAARSIALYMNSYKTEFVCFKQDGAISTLNHKPVISQSSVVISHLLKVMLTYAWL